MPSCRRQELRSEEATDMLTSRGSKRGEKYLLLVWWQRLTGSSESTGSSGPGAGSSPSGGAPGPACLLHRHQQSQSAMMQNAGGSKKPSVPRELTSLHDGRLIARANREHFEHSAGGPEQLLVREGPHDVHQGLRATAGQNDELQRGADSGFLLASREAERRCRCCWPWGHRYLALLVAVGQNLQAVGGDGQELDVGVGEQSHHLLQASGQAHGHLGAFLVQQQVVERGDGVEENAVHWRAAQTC